MRQFGSSSQDLRSFGKSLLQGILLGLLVSGVFMGGYFFRGYLDRTEKTETSYELLNEIEAYLLQDYLYDLPTNDFLIHAAASGMVKSLNDPYTYFVEPITAEVDEGNLAGRFGGIGIEVVRDAEGRYIVHEVYRDNPASEAGIMVGDIITAVDGVEVNVSAADQTELQSAIRGDIGQPLTMTVLRGEELLTFDLVRAELLIPSAFWQISDVDNRIGYIQIRRFTSRTPDELSTALNELISLGAEAYIVDLRDNGGGLVDSAVAVVDQFIDQGQILHEIRKGSEEKTFTASRGGLAINEPIVVLTNGGTASAAEIVAGALQDLNRATLIGSPTYGKGSVQLIRPLSDGSSLHVTTAEWYTPSEIRIEAQGLVPDITVNAEADPGLAVESALEFLMVELDNTQ